MRGRKGFLGDGAYIIGVAFLITLVFIVGGKVLSDFNTEWQGADVSNGSQELVSGLDARYASLFDGIFAFFIGIMSLALVISTAMLGTRPEFFFIVVILSIFLIGAAALVSNAYDSFADDFGNEESRYTYIPLVMNNLVEVTLLLISLLVIGLFVKARGIV